MGTCVDSVDLKRFFVCFLNVGLFESEKEENKREYRNKHSKMDIQCDRRGFAIISFHA